MADGVERTLEQRVGEAVSGRLAAEQAHGGRVDRVEQNGVVTVGNAAVDQREAVAARHAQRRDIIGGLSAAEDAAIARLHVGAQRGVQSGSPAVAQRAVL